jgi:predicted ATPase
VAIVSTSREPLGVAPEHVWRVRSLDPEGEGVELFVTRATAAASFTLEARTVVVELCPQLDATITAL